MHNTFDETTIQSRAKNEVIIELKTAVWIDMYGMKKYFQRVMLDTHIISQNQIGFIRHL